jgi:hypothetical protein
MDEKTVRAVVLEAFKEIQTMSGRPWADLSDKSRPIGVLPGFDSPNGIEFCCAIEEKLNCEIPDDENLCVEDLPKGRRRARSLKDIVELVCKVVEAQGAKV